MVLGGRAFWTWSDLERSARMILGPLYRGPQELPVLSAMWGHMVTHKCCLWTRSQTPILPALQCWTFSFQNCEVNTFLLYISHSVYNNFFNRFYFFEYSTPNMGLEPTTPRSRVTHFTDWASQAPLTVIFYSNPRWTKTLGAFYPVPRPTTVTHSRDNLPDFFSCL